MILMLSALQSAVVICSVAGYWEDRAATITTKLSLIPTFNASTFSPKPINASPRFSNGPTPKFNNMSSLIGAEYTPWRATNQLWWHNYSQHRSDVVREVKAMREVLGFTAVRVFLHDMLWDADASGFLSNIEDFLAILEGHNMQAGFVFFDDCWAHSGANLSITCIPKKGVHNGCWVAGPQDVKRTSTERFKAYVGGVVSHFKADKRVAWWEIFNEPRKGNMFSMSLRDAAFRFAKAANPVAPVISCWDDNNNTEVVDTHQYSDKWNQGSVFSNPAKGGIITEGGCRWYQQDKDHGSPLTLVNFLESIRKGGSAAAGAPFR
jgi:hypothetical protein